MSERDVRDLLHQGEQIEHDVDVGHGRLVVTDRRVLAFTPDTPGKNYRHVERPNLTGIGVRNRGATGNVWKAAPYFVLCGLLIATGLVFDPGRPLSGIPTGSVAFGAGMIDTIDYWIARSDDLAILFGILSGLPAALYVANYLRTRREVIAIEIAGEDDIDLSTDGIESPGDAVDRIRGALDLPAGPDDEGPEWRGS